MVSLNTFSTDSFHVKHIASCTCACFVHLAPKISARSLPRTVNTTESIQRVIDYCLIDASDQMVACLPYILQDKHFAI